MEGIRILLLASSIGATMAGTLYAGVQAERTRSQQEVARALTPVALNPIPQSELIPQVEPLEPPVEELAEGAAVPDFDELDRLNEIDVQNAVASGVDVEDIVLDSGLRIGALEPVEVDPELASREVAESARPSRSRGRRAPPRPPLGPRLHPNPGQHSVLTARRMIAQNELIQGSCYAYLSEVYARAGHRSWRKRTIVYRAEREGPYADLSLIRPGDWLYIVNDPGRTPVGTHSVMFTGWQDQARGYARTISHAGWGPARSGRERGYDVSQTYRIIRPTM
ncbi:MAG: hypothetical protein ACI9KE_004929 [Polyangiales bacterium]|jgi:hypothetical protein